MRTCCGRVSTRLGVYTEPRTTRFMGRMNDDASLSDAAEVEGGRK
jgi:hypothetical protein